ncbi:MAG: HAMP domain-containing sensor histidine kinase, partial [Prolixibacteraceae bacterium]
KLIELNTTKDKFFSIIAHDLINPFNAIIGLSNHLLELVKGKHYEQIAEFASIILKSSNRAFDLLLNLMEWAQSQSGRMEFKPEYFELNAIIKEEILLLNGNAEQKSIIIATELSSIILVNADKAMLSTVLRNLISNAIKFTNQKGKITIASMFKQHELIISVIDNGVGMSKERLNQLFKIDESYSTRGTQNENGTGLGLILCKEFIEKNNGKIWAESEIGVGTTFYFSLPIDIENKQIIEKM